MPRTDDGEFELVLYNRQLLSVFFVVVVLLGIFFAMGYIVGRNAAAPERVAKAEPPIIVEPSRPSGSPPAAAPKPQPAQDIEEIAPSAPETPQKASEAKPAQPAPAPAATKPESAKPTAAPVQAQPASFGPQPGQTYLQVAATTRVEAEALREQLSRKGFGAAIGPVPGQELYRVLVGPVNDPAALAKTRSALQELGLKPFTRRY